MTKTFQAAVVQEKAARFDIRALTLDEPRANEVVVRIHAVGVCHTDLSMQAQHMPVSFPAVFGHEGAGVVEAVGSAVTKVAPGDHVVLGFASCGSCRQCLRGLPSYCADYYGQNFGGARPDGTSALRSEGKSVAGHFFGQSSFGELSLAYERNVIKVPHDIPLELLGPLGCGVQTGAGAILRSLRVESGSSVVVFGTGAVGLSAVMAARVAGATQIIGVDLDASRRALALDLGATEVLDGATPDIVSQIQKLTNGGANYTIETTGQPQVLSNAVDSLMVTGICGAIGGSPTGTTAAINMNNLIFGRTIRGICEGDSVPELFIPELIELYRQGRFPLDRLIRTYPFNEINQACEDARSGRVVKPVLTFP